MKRRNFFSLVIASVASFFLSGFKRVRSNDWEPFFQSSKLQRRRLFTDEMAMTDAVELTEDYKFKLVNHEFFTRLCDDLNHKLANHFDSSKDVPIDAIKIYYRNILSRIENPLGEIGFFDVIAERRSND